MKLRWVPITKYNMKSVESISLVHSGIIRFTCYYHLGALLNSLSRVMLDQKGGDYE